MGAMMNKLKKEKMIHHSFILPVLSTNFTLHFTKLFLSNWTITNQNNSPWGGSTLHSQQWRNSIGQFSLRLGKLTKLIIDTDVLEEKDLVMNIQWNTDVKMTRSILQILEEKVNSLSLPTLKTYDQNFLKDMIEIF